MKKKIISAVPVIIITLFAVSFFITGDNLDREVLSQTFHIDAIYYENQKYVEITFEDSTLKTTSVVLEILGMKESYQETFTDSNFVQQIPFESLPVHGWQIHPITLLVTHDDFGTVGIKTEIHSVDEPKPPVIFSKR